MPIETICQGCSKKLRVADEHAGKQARCPSCGNIYIVPQPTPTSYSPIATPAYQPLAKEPANEPTREPMFANPPAKQLGERWFMKIDDGREFGPVDRATLDQWLQERRIGPTTRLKREYDTQWQLASAVFPSLGGNVPAMSASGGNPFSDQPQGGVNPYANSGFAGSATSYVEPHRGGMILALALVSWFTCFLVGIAAWVMANEDLRKMRSGQMDNSGYGLTQAGQIIGIVNVVLSCLGVGFFFLAVVISAAGR